MTKEEQNKAYAAAAGHIAGAVATAYFGPAAGPVADAAVTAIAGAILGGDDDKFEKEIISKLDQINSKIDLIILFCNHGFREMVDEALTDDRVRQLMVDVSNDQVRFRGAMSAYVAAKPPTEADALNLIEKAEEMLSAGRSIYARSRERYLIAVPYFAQALGALLLVQQRTSKYVGTAARWADQYKKDLTPWMTQGATGSFPEVRAQVQRRLGIATEVMKDFVVGQPVRYINFLIPIWSPVMGVGAFPVGGSVSETYAYGAEYVLNADSTVSVSDLRIVGTAPRSVSVTEDMEVVFGIKSHPSFPPRIGSERNNAYWNDVYSYMYQAIAERAIELRDLPPRLDALDFAIKVLEPFLAGLGELSATIAYEMAVERIAASAGARLAATNA